MCPPPGNAPQEQLYIQALTGTRFTNILLPLAGRFTFDPVPVLREYMQGADKKSVFPSISVFHAACVADPRWAETMAPLVVDLAQSLPQVRKTRDRDKAYRGALDALNKQGQRTAWDDLKASLGSEQVKAAHPADWGKVRRCRM